MGVTNFIAALNINSQLTAMFTVSVLWELKSYFSPHGLGDQKTVARERIR